MVFEGFLRIFKGRSKDFLGIDFSGFRLVFLGVLGGSLLFCLGLQMMFLGFDV